MLTHTNGAVLVADRHVRIATALFAATFGAMLLYFVAFAHSDILHNAAHDTRHAIVAPCH